MKYGKNLSHVIELSDPEWGPYWINYKFMKKRIKEIVKMHGGKRASDPSTYSDPNVISKCAAERKFFRLLRTELKKTSDFFSSSEQLCYIRYQCVRDGFVILQDNTVLHDDHAWTRLLMACVKFYKDVLLLENFAIMNYCGFSKILKKHDKWTGFTTCEAFMFNVMSHENFTNHPNVISLLVKSEKLFTDIQGMERYFVMLFVALIVPLYGLLNLPLNCRCSPLQADERLFIEAIRDLNRQASRLQAEENLSMITKVVSVNGWISMDNSSSSQCASDPTSTSTSVVTSHSDPDAKPSYSAEFSSPSSNSPI